MAAEPFDSLGVSLSGSAPDSAVRSELVSGCMAGQGFTDMTAAYIAELTGGQGPTPAAAAIANGKSMPDLGLLGELVTDSEDDAAADSRVDAASQAWAGCVQADGFAGTTPGTISADALVSASAGDTDQGRRRLAEADAACTRSTNLAGIYFAVLDGYQDELIADNQQTVDQVEQAAQAQNAFVQDYIADNGG